MPAKSITDVQSILAKHGKQDTVVLFGFDKTVVQSEQPLGSKMWRDYIRQQVNRLEEEKIIPKALLAKHLTNIARFAVPLKPIEGSVTLSTFASLKAEKIPYFMVTARPKDFIDIVQDGFARSTIRQLKLSGIEIPAIPELQAALYEGFLFADETNKGSSITLLFADNNFTPKHVIFFDNSYEALQSAELAFNDLGISFVGLHRTYCESFFDPMIANIQLEMFLNEGQVPDLAEANGIKEKLRLKDPDEHFKRLILNSYHQIIEKSFNLMRSL